MAVWTGLEPATSCVTGRHSNQLNYQTAIYKTICFRNYTKEFKIINYIRLGSSVGRAKV